MSIRPAIFRSEAFAWSFADRSRKTHMVLLGDDECWWVVTFAEAATLVRAGYELAERC